MSFTDDFNRADGPVDNGWTDAGDACTISGGYPTSLGTAHIIRVQGGAGDNQTVTLNLDRDDQSGYGPSPTLKCSADGTSRYQANINWSGGSFNVYIYRFDNGTPTLLSSDGISAAPTSTPVVVFSYSSGNLSLRVNGTVRLTATDSSLSDNTRQGLFSPGLIIKVDSITVASAPVPSMVIVPTLVSGLGGQIVLQAIGTNTEWSNNPASTVFTADKGAINEQTIIDSHNVLILWTIALGAYEITTFTESQYGLTATVDSDSSLPPDYGKGYNLTSDAAQVLARTGAYCDQGRLLTTCEPIDAEGTVNIPKGIDAIIEQLGGYSGQVGPDIGAVSIPANIYALFERPVVNPYWTAEDMVGSLGGSPTVYSNADLYDALGNLPAATYQPVLDALVALQGANPPTLADLGTMISNIATIAGYTLADVHDWIDAIPPTDLTAITDKLDLIQPSTAADLTTLTNQMTGVDNVVDAINGVLGVVTDGGTLTLQMILDAISALSDLVSALSPKTAPVWPSLAEVTLGTPVAFDGNVDVTAAMDGVLVNLTQSPTKTGHYALGNVDLWYGLGRIAFESDNGDVEPWQYLAYDNGLFAPKSMQHASAVHLQVLGGAEGTVTPWTITSPAPAPAVRTAKYSYRFDDDDPAGG